MEALCEMCKLLYNPLRLEILMRTYAARDGVNVGVLGEAMKPSGLGVSGVSQYLKQLERIGVVRRERAGCYVNYMPDTRRARPKVRQFVEALVAGTGKDDLVPLEPVFGALMNPFRARVVSAVAQAGAIPAAEICERTHHPSRHLGRDLRMAVDAGLIDPDDSEATCATYHYVEPADPLSRLLVSLFA